MTMRVIYKHRLEEGGGGVIITCSGNEIEKIDDDLSNSEFRR